MNSPPVPSAAMAPTEVKEGSESVDWAASPAGNRVRLLAAEKARREEAGEAHADRRARARRAACSMALLESLSSYLVLRRVTSRPLMAAPALRLRATQTRQRK